MDQRPEWDYAGALPIPAQAVRVISNLGGSDTIVIIFAPIVCTYIVLLSRADGSAPHDDDLGNLHFYHWEHIGRSGGVSHDSALT
jgi:hypothetical protein